MRLRIDYDDGTSEVVDPGRPSVWLALDTDPELAAIVGTWPEDSENRVALQAFTARMAWVCATGGTGPDLATWAKGVASVEVLTDADPPEAAPATS